MWWRSGLPLTPSRPVSHLHPFVAAPAVDRVVSKNTNDSGLLVTLEPASDGDDQQGSGLALPPHDRGF